MDIVGLVPCAEIRRPTGLPFSITMLPDLYHPTYRPVLMYTIEALQAAGVRHVVLTVDPRSQDLMTYLGNGTQFGMRFTYCLHPEPRTFAELVAEAQHVVMDSTVLFAMPDTVVSPTDALARLVAAHGRAPHRDVTLGCFQTDGPSRFGRVDDVDGLVRRLPERATGGGLAWTWGAIVWEPTFMRELRAHLLQLDKTAQPAAGQPVLTDAMAGLIAGDRVRAVHFDMGVCTDVGTTEAYLAWCRRSWPSGVRATAEPAHANGRPRTM